jgi:hypothetical protein
MTIYPALTNRLQTQHKAIEAILSTVDEARLLLRPQPDKWNIHDNLAHLVRYQPVFTDRINQILLTEEPVFGRYKAEDDPGFEVCRALPTEVLLTQLDIDREYLYNLITKLTEAALNRIGMHKKYGRLTVLQWTEFFLLHEAHHIFTIFQLAHDTEL